MHEQDARGNEDHADDSKAADPGILSRLASGGSGSRKEV
jgi:hypothetical protein